MSKREAYEDASPLDWRKWPNGVGVLQFNINFFVDAKDAQAFAQAKNEQELAASGVSSYDLEMIVTVAAINRSFSAKRLENDEIEITTDYSPSADDVIMNSGKIKSVLDLRGSTMFIEDTNEAKLKFEGLGIFLKNHQPVDIDPSRIETISARGKVMYRYAFPPAGSVLI